jgi:hypothetical protein
VEDVQTALEAMRMKGDGSTSSAATLNTYVAAVKALLGFAHKVGFHALQRRAVDQAS